ncbi:Peptidylglycine alpha-hydroxylating monooxygenase [Orchesella cincta]|uniref:peptidylglycine monooxygenase n=1 Tax=Orchesella cincta TaxID=48709 RepID=A0A1D2MKY2_ORCCI|nr:Peptidylglycine alpha-hydroxylating monooxygenase [Orchesella cincta]
MGAVHHMLLYGCTEPGLINEQVWNCGGMGGDEEDVLYSGESLLSGSICSEGQQRILYAWAKNAPSLILPEDVGFEIGGKSGIASLVLQLHFGDPHDMPMVWNLANGQIGLTLEVTEQRQKKLAGVYLLATGGSVEPRATTFLESACIMKEEKTIYPFAFRTHSHSLGKVISGYRVRVDEFGECKWSLIGKKDPQLPQMFYPVEHYIPVKNGDILAARCTMESNRKRMTYIGPTRNDEMCNFYIMYYVTDGQILEADSCGGEGPFENYWERNYPTLNNFPDDASLL